MTRFSAIEEGILYLLLLTVLFFLSLDNRSSEVFASPDRQIRVIKFNKEPGKLLGEKSREQLLLF